VSSDRVLPQAVRSSVRFRSLADQVDPTAYEA